MAKRTLLNYFGRAKVPRLPELEDEPANPSSGRGRPPVLASLAGSNGGGGFPGAECLAGSSGGGGFAGAECLAGSSGGGGFPGAECLAGSSGGGGFPGAECLAGSSGGGGGLAGSSERASPVATDLAVTTVGTSKAESSGNGDRGTSGCEIPGTANVSRTPKAARRGKKSGSRAGKVSATGSDVGSTGQVNEPDGAGGEVRRQKFRSEWLTGELECFEAYKHDEYFARCKVCLDIFSVARGGKSNLSTHINTQRHKENASTITLSDSKIDDYVREDQGTLIVMEAELKICSWAVENNVSFSAVDSLISVLKTLDPESKLFNRVKLGRTKAAAVVTGVIAEQQHSELVQRMQTKPFTLFIDESTDNTASKTLAMVVRVFSDGGRDDPDEFEAKDVFYAAVEVHLADHRSLYNAIVEQFKKDDIDYKRNLKGFASDTANVMMGKDNSVMSLLKKDCSGLNVVKCSCHSLALCASYACKEIPDYCENLLRDIYSFLNNSPKRTMEFKLIQEIVELKPVRMLHPSATRWLSLGQVVKRCLERFEELRTFFKFQANVDKNSTALRILDHLEDKMTKPLLLFLNYILPLINDLNRLFQSEEPQITLIHEEITNLETTIISNLCKDDFIASLTNFNVDVPADTHFKDVVYVGVEAEAAAAGLDSERFRKFNSICKNFYKELHKQLRKRFDLNDPVLLAASKLNPSSLKKQDSICPLLTALPGLHEGGVQEIENEFRLLKMKLARKEISTECESAQKWWKGVLSMMRADGKLAFPLLRVFVQRVFLIPHSSACVERIFSQYNNNKTKLRNRLIIETMQAILKAKHYVKDHGGSTQIKLTNEIRQRFKMPMYKHHSSNQNS